jgi:hypothetical protein
MKMTVSFNNSLYWIVTASFLQFDVTPPISKGVTILSVISPEYADAVKRKFGK